MATTFDAAATPTFSGANVASLTSPSWTLTGSNLYVHAGVLSGANTPVDPSAVKVGGSGGTAMTQKGATQNVGTNVKVSAWGLANASAGSTTSYVSWASNQDETALVAASYAGVDTSTPNRTVATATGSNATPSVAATSVSGDLVVDVAGFLDGNGAALTLTVGASQTSHGEVEGSNLTFEGLGTSHEAATTTSTTMSWTISGTPQQGWATIAYALIPSSGAVVTSKTMSDTTVVADSGVQWNRRTRRSDETLTIADSIVKMFIGGAIIKVMSDTIALSDQLIEWTRRKRVMSETMDVSDDPNRIIQMIADDDTLNITDDQSRLRKAGRVASDTISVTDGATYWLRLKRVASDTLDSVDQFVKSVISGGALTITKVMSDVLATSDTVVQWLRRVRGPIDSVTVSEGNTYRTSIITANESVDLTDESVSWRRCKRIAQDNLDLIDSFVKILGFNRIVYAKVMSDSVTLVDDAGRRWTLRGRQLNDTVGLNDQTIRYIRAVRALGDVVEFSDGTVKIRRTTKSADDSIEVSDGNISTLHLDQLSNTSFTFGASGPPFRFGGN